jgi:hypothetical protein
MYSCSCRSAADVNLAFQLTQDRLLETPNQIDNNPHTLRQFPRSSNAGYSDDCLLGCAEYLGCYPDWSGCNKVLPERIHWDDPTITPEKCVDSARRFGFRYVGLQGGTHCWGGHFAPGTIKTTDDRCAVPNTGGYGTSGAACFNSVWETGLHPTCCRRQPPLIVAHLLAYVSGRSNVIYL